MQEAVNSGLINPVNDFIDQSDYQEIFSRFAILDDQRKTDVLDVENLRIEGIQRCYENHKCSGVEDLTEKFKNRDYQAVLNDKLWREIGEKVRSVSSLWKVYDRINKLVE